MAFASGRLISVTKRSPEATRAECGTLQRSGSSTVRLHRKLLADLFTRHHVFLAELAQASENTYLQTTCRGCVTMWGHHEYRVAQKKKTSLLDLQILRVPGHPFDLLHLLN